MAGILELQVVLISYSFEKTFYLQFSFPGINKIKVFTLTPTPILSYVSLPRLLETNRKSESPSLKGSSVFPFSERKYDISCEVNSPLDHDFMKKF